MTVSQPKEVDALGARKKALRVAMREMRSLRAADPSAPSDCAQGLLAGSELCAGARVIALYQALPSEVQTDLLGASLVASGKVVCYPLVRDVGRALAFRRAVGPFRVGPLGVREPVGDEIPLDAIDVFVVPAVAVDLSGRRLGRGRGHYDSTFAKAGGRAQRVALVFDWQVVAEVPAGARDARMDFVCTETRLLRSRMIEERP